MKRPAVVLLLLGMLGTAIAANGKVQVGTLAGIVLDSRGRVVADAAVTIETSDGLHPHATRTDKDGRFEFARYRTGQYDLRASARGATSAWIERVMIRSGKTTKVTLRLAPTNK